MINQILPYGIVQYIANRKWRSFVKNFVPNGIVEHYQDNKIQYTEEYLRTHYVTDLSEPEKWAILTYLLEVERNCDKAQYLEIGIFAGATIKFLLEKTLSASFTGVDLFEDFIPSGDNTHKWKNFTMQQIHNVLGYDRVTLYKGESAKVLATLHDKRLKFDLIFIDGNHTYEATMRDFEKSLPLLNENGFVVFHNCSAGLSPEDKRYIETDGGPWRVTNQLAKDSRFVLEYMVDRVKIFRYKH